MVSNIKKRFDCVIRVEVTIPPTHTHLI
jgi:protein pelota